MPDYLITSLVAGNADSAPVKSERIVRAKNRATAIQHVVSDTITAERASVDDAMRIAAAGGKVEIASDE